MENHEVVMLPEWLVTIITGEIRNARKIYAIKALKNHKDWGLKQTKDYIDYYMRAYVDGEALTYDDMSNWFYNDHMLNRNPRVATTKQRKPRKPSFEKWVAQGMEHGFFALINDIKQI